MGVLQEPLIPRSTMVYGATQSERTMFKCKFLSVFAVHVVIVCGCMALLELHPGVNDHFQSLVQDHKWAWIITPLVLTPLLLLPSLLNRVWLTSIAILLGSISQSVAFAAIDVATDSYGMLLNTGFMVVCMHMMIPITYLQPHAKDEDAYEQVRQPIAGAFLASLAIATALFYFAGRDLFTMQGFWISMASQLVFVFSVQCELAYTMLNQDDFMKSVLVNCAMPIVYPVNALVAGLILHCT